MVITYRKKILYFIDIRDREYLLKRKESKM